MQPTIITVSTDQITAGERAQIAAYATHMQLRDLERFSDAQVYRAFAGEFNSLMKAHEEATGKGFSEAHISIDHLMFDCVAISAELEQKYEDRDYWILSDARAAEFAQIIREAHQRTSEG
jgi:flagellar motor protein MotB